MVVGRSTAADHDRRRSHPSSGALAAQPRGVVDPTVEWSARLVQPTVPIRVGSRQTVAVAVRSPVSLDRTSPLVGVVEAAGGRERLSRAQWEHVSGGGGVAVGVLPDLPAGRWRAAVRVGDVLLVAGDVVVR